MFQEEFNHIVTNISNLRDIDLADVKTIADRYPYCQVAQVIYAKKLHDLNSALFDNQLKKASISVYDRSVLFKIIEKTQLAEPVGAGFQEVENIIPQEHIDLLAEVNVADNSTNEADNKEAEVLVEELMESIPELQQEDAVIDSVVSQTDALVENQDPQEILKEELIVDSTLEEDNEITVPITDLGTDFELPSVELIPEAEEYIPEQETNTLINELSSLEEDQLVEELMNSIPELVDEVPLVYETIEENETISEIQDLQLLDNEEEPEEPILEAELINQEVIAEEQILSELIDEIPELQPEMQVIPEEEEMGLAVTELIDHQFVILEETNIDALQDYESLPEVEPVSEMETFSPEELGHEEIELIESDLVTPFFDAPLYNIDKELGTLSDDEIIRFPIARPERESIPLEEVYADSFTGWLNRLGGNHSVRVVEQKEKNRPISLLKREEESIVVSPEPTVKRVMNEDIAAHLAKKSLQFDDNLTTETLARIMVMQGKYAKAIEMYSHLSLLKPQKSDYFAALIDQLKKRIK